jgi:hypothetical protein
MGGISNGDDDFRFHGELTNCNGDIKYIWINLITTSLTICHNAKWWLGSGGMISNWPYFSGWKIMTYFSQKGFDTKRPSLEQYEENIQGNNKRVFFVSPNNVPTLRGSYGKCSSDGLCLKRTAGAVRPQTVRSLGHWPSQVSCLPDLSGRCEPR